MAIFASSDFAMSLGQIAARQHMSLMHLCASCSRLLVCLNLISINADKFIDIDDKV